MNELIVIPISTDAIQKLKELFKALVKVIRIALESIKRWLDQPCVRRVLKVLRANPKKQKYLIRRYMLRHRNQRR